jgi:hypothetical protein
MKSATVSMPLGKRTGSTPMVPLNVSPPSVLLRWVCQHYEQSTSTKHAVSEGRCKRVGNIELTSSMLRKV